MKIDYRAVVEELRKKIIELISSEIYADVELGKKMNAILNEIEANMKVDKFDWGA